MKIQKTIAEFLGDRKFARMAPTDSVLSAMDLMKQHSADCVLVCERGKLVGVFSAWDMLSRVAAAELDATTTPVGDVMTRDPETLPADACITYVINRMAHGGYRNVPVVDASGTAVGNVSVRDVLSHLSEVFGDLEDGRDEPEWTDLGGGD